MPQWLWGVILLLVLLLAAWLVSELTGPAAAERTAVSSVGSAGYMIDLFLKLMFLLGLIFIGLYYVRRWQRKARVTSSRKLHILETRHLAPKQAVHLIKAGRQVFLVGATDHGISLISEIPAEGIPDPAAEVASFAAALEMSAAGQSEVQEVSGREDNTAGEGKAES